MPNDIATKQDLVNRMKSVSGHVNGIVRMVDEDEYCIDIINQVQAVQAALTKVNIILLDDHMQHCVSDALRSQNPREKDRVNERFAKGEISKVEYEEIKHTISA